MKTCSLKLKHYKQQFESSVDRHLLQFSCKEWVFARKAPVQEAGESPKRCLDYNERIWVQSILLLKFYPQQRTLSCLENKQKSGV